MPLNKIILSLLVIFFVISGDMKSQLSGTYYIGVDKDYEKIADAVDTLNSKGIDSSVVFKIHKGIYEEQFIIKEFNIPDTNFSVLFTKYDDDSVVIQKDIVSSETNYLVKMDSCQRVTFKNIIFKTNSDSFSNHIRLKGGASHNRFENCVFKASKEINCELVNEQDGIVIYDEPSADKNEFNKFINNKIIGGCIGISLEGKSGQLEEGNEIIGNHLTYQRKSAVKVVNNSEGRLNEDTVIYKGLGAAVTLNVDSVYEIQGNTIYSEGSTALFIDTFNAKQPLLFNLASIPFDGLSVSNNKISCPGGVALKGNKIKGLFMGHNTLFNESDSLFTMEIDSVIYMLSVYNLLVNKETNGVFKITTNAVSNIPLNTWWLRQLGSDLNGVYSKDSTIGMINGKLYTSLAHWQDSCPYGPDPHSYFGKIDFDNCSTGLKLICGTSPSMQIEKNQLPGLIQDFLTILKNKGYFKDVDINGATRDTSKFWIGHSDEYSPPAIGVKGYITDSTGTDTITDGKVQVFAKRANKEMLEKIDEFIISDGSYNFDTLPYRENYWLKIIPDKDLFPDYLPSYPNPTKSLRWDASDDIPRPLSDFCIDDIVNNIFPRKLVELPQGDYTISGNVSGNLIQTTGQTKMDAVSDPIPGLDVILDRIPPSPPTSIAITQTDSEGNYTFSNLPASGDSGKYVITIDAQGLPADTIYEVSLTGDVKDLNYCVDTETQIEACLDLGVEEKNILFEDLLLFPNPMDKTLTVSGVKEKFDVHVFDVQGKEIFTLMNQREGASIPVANFESGLYLVVIQTPSDKKTCKIMK